jgi:hypothetical protein
MNLELSEKTAERLEIEDLIFSQPTTMSKYQIDNFVINEKMTDYKILKQILLELGTRYIGYDEIKIDIQIADLELKQMQLDLENLSGIPYKIAVLNIKKKEATILGLERTIRNHEYELKILEDNYVKLKSRNDDIQSILEDETGEEIYWVNKFIKEAQIDIMTTGRIGKGVLDAIMMLPEQLQTVIVQNAITQASNSNGFIGSIENKIIEDIKTEKEVSLMLNTLVGQKIENKG